MNKTHLKLSFCTVLLLSSSYLLPGFSQSTESSVQAQEPYFLGIPPENIVSVNKDIPLATYDTMLVVPEDCSFMITDVIITPVDTSLFCFIKILSNLDPEEKLLSVRAPANASTAMSYSVTMSSGIPLSPGTSIIASNPLWSSDANVTVSGYVFGCSW